MRLKMIYLLRLSLASLKFFNASIAALDIKKTTPKYIPRKVTITPNPTDESSKSVLNEYPTFPI